MMCCNLRVKSIIKGGQAIPSPTSALALHPHSVWPSSLLIILFLLLRELCKPPSHATALQRQKAMFGIKEFLGNLEKKELICTKFSVFFPNTVFTVFPLLLQSIGFLCYFFPAVNVLLSHPTINTVSHRLVYGLSVS